MRRLVEFSGGRAGEYVRFHGVRHKVVATKANNSRVYLCEETGETFPLTRAEQVHHAYETTLTTDASWTDVVTRYVDVLDIEWGPGGFTEQEIHSAYQKIDFLRILDTINEDGTHKYDAKQRRTSKVIRAVIAEARAQNSELPEVCVESIRRWDYKWIASGRDPRVLADRHSDKGRSGPLPELAWIDQIIHATITKYTATPPYYTAEQIHAVVEPIVAATAAENGYPVHPKVRENAYYGIHRVRMLYNMRTMEERYLVSKGRREARRSAKGHAVGPSGDYALHHVEADHHQMDIEVVTGDRKKVAGRPWLTVLLDRYSRMIIGFYLSMEHPSWFSIAEALRMAVYPKEEYLASLPYKFTFEWKCHGSMDFLFVDRGAEFHGLYSKAMASLLHFVPVDLPRARGDLKGKIERWFGVVSNRQISRLPGYIGSSPKKRVRETAVPKITLQELEVVVASFIVDHYNVTQHGETGEWPSKRFDGSMRSNKILKLPPKPGLLGLITSPPQAATLSDRGVTVNKAIYYSDDLLGLWHTEGKIQVMVHPDAKDARRVRVHAGGKHWIEAHLQGKFANLHVTPSELRDLITDKTRPKETAEEKQRQLQAASNINQYIDTLAPRPDAPQRAPQQRQKPVTHLNKPVIDPKGSSGSLQGYNSNNPVASNRYDSGEFGGPTISEQVMSGTLDATRYQPGAPPIAPAPADPAPPTAVTKAPGRRAKPVSSDEYETITL